MQCFDRYLPATNVDLLLCRRDRVTCLRQRRDLLRRLQLLDHYDWLRSSYEKTQPDLRYQP